MEFFPFTINKSLNSDVNIKFLESGFKINSPIM